MARQQEQIIKLSHQINNMQRSKLHCNTSSLQVTSLNDRAGSSMNAPHNRLASMTCTEDHSVVYNPLLSEEPSMVL